MDSLWTPKYIGDQDGFLESMAAAAQAVVNYFKKENGIIYISVMNNMSIDCDCVDHPAPVKARTMASSPAPTPWPSTRLASISSTTRR